MTDAQTEARAIARCVRGCATDNQYIELVERIEAALTAKDAELAVQREAKEHARRECDRAETQLAEARKALEPFADDAFISMCANHEDDYYPDWSPFISCGQYRATRRALEAQGGENG